MSEPVTNMEIEDVLSSIRKLVSDDGRAGSKPAEPEAAKKANKLVLTPALRVSEPAQAGSIGEPISGAWDDEADESAEASSGDADIPWSDPDATLYDAAKAADQDSESAEPRPDSNRVVSEPMLLRPEDAVSVEVDDTAAVEPTISDPAGTHGEDERPAAASLDQSDDEFAPQTHEPSEPIDDEGAAQPLSKKIEALEAAIGRTNEQWEPDGATDEDYSGTRVETIAWESQTSTPGPVPEGPSASSDAEDDIEAIIATPADVKADATAEPDSIGIADKPEFVAKPRETERPASVDEVAEPEETDQDVLTSEEAILDEDSLRDLVSEIVRQELQGALGERITRNVRKLVRREIHRVLTARDLE